MPLAYQSNRYIALIPWLTFAHGRRDIIVAGSEFHIGIVFRLLTQSTMAPRRFYPNRFYEARDKTRRWIAPWPTQQGLLSIV